LALAVVGWLAVALLIREIVRRLSREYEYRFDSFAVRGWGGRQLFQIRRGEISALEPLTLAEGLLQRWIMRRLVRSSLARKVVIRSRIAHMKPVVVSWEGRPIAGLIPQGIKAGAGACAPDETLAATGVSDEIHPEPADGLPPACGVADVPVPRRRSRRRAVPQRAPDAR
jgi:hypothetical protein